MEMINVSGNMDPTLRKSFYCGAGEVEDRTADRSRTKGPYDEPIGQEEKQTQRRLQIWYKSHRQKLKEVVKRYKWVLHLAALRE
jgi:hypothetical protein